MTPPPPPHCFDACPLRSSSLVIVHHGEQVIVTASDQVFDLLGYSSQQMEQVVRQPSLAVLGFSTVGDEKQQLIHVRHAQTRQWLQLCVCVHRDPFATSGLDYCLVKRVTKPKPAALRMQPLQPLSRPSFSSSFSSLSSSSSSNASLVSAMSTSPPSPPPPWSSRTNWSASTCASASASSSSSSSSTSSSSFSSSSSSSTQNEPPITLLGLNAYGTIVRAYPSMDFPQQAAHLVGRPMMAFVHSDDVLALCTYLRQSCEFAKKGGTTTDDTALALRWLLPRHGGGRHAERAALWVHLTVIHPAATTAPTAQKKPPPQPICLLQPVHTANSNDNDAWQYWYEDQPFSMRDLWHWFANARLYFMDYMTHLMKSVLNVAHDLSCPAPMILLARLSSLSLASSFASSSVASNVAFSAKSSFSPKAAAVSPLLATLFDSDVIYESLVALLHLFSFMPDTTNTCKSHTS
ncbi:hypothetical protein BC940DRAFT_287407 [Gongronella butleri]|nr:hypothetical protein BC940DRAFT_287407 [Gongronella butleri]